MLHLARFQKELETQGFLIKRFQHTTDFERDIKEDLRDAAMKLSNTSPVVARGRRLFRASIRRRGTVDRPSSHGLAVPKPEGGSWLTASPRPGLTHLCATRAGEVQLLAVGYDDGLVRLEHGSTNRLANTYDYGGRRRSLKDLAGRSEGVSSRAKSFGHQVLTRRSRLLTSRVSSIEMSSSSCQLFVTRGDGTITKVDMTSVADPVEDLIGKLTSLPLATHWCEVEPHGGELLVGCEDGLVFAWNIETLECKKSSSLSLAGEPASPVDASLNHMVIGELDGSITIAASTDDKLITWGVGREPRERVVDSPITALELVQVVGRKGLIVFGDASGDITAVYASGTRMKTEHDALSQGPRDTLEAGDGTSGRPAAITALAGFAERAGAYVAVGGRDGTVRVWDAKAAHFVRGWRIRESSRIGAIAWCRSDDELELWIAQRDGRVTSRELSYSETWQAAR